MLQIQNLIGQSARIVLSLAVMLFAGLGVSFLTRKLRLPDVTGYILAGVLIGPYCLNAVSEAVRVNMEFVTDIAL